MNSQTTTINFADQVLALRHEVHALRQQQVATSEVVDACAQAIGEMYQIVRDLKIKSATTEEELALKYQETEDY